MYSVEWSENNINRVMTFDTIDEAEEYEESIRADADQFPDLKIDSQSIQITTQ